MVGEAAVLALCVGNDLGTGKWLTLRRNAVRRSGGKRLANRWVFYDLTISPPKSVSVMALLRDQRVVSAHERAVSAALVKLERFAETRVRRDQQDGGGGGIFAMTPWRPKT